LCLVSSRRRPTHQTGRARRAYVGGLSTTTVPLGAAFSLRFHYYLQRIHSLFTCRRVSSSYPNRIRSLLLASRGCESGQEALNCQLTGFEAGPWATTGCEAGQPVSKRVNPLRNRLTGFEAGQVANRVVTYIPLMQPERSSRAAYGRVYDMHMCKCYIRLSNNCWL